MEHDLACAIGRLLLLCGRRAAARPVHRRRGVHRGERLLGLLLGRVHDSSAGLGGRGGGGRTGVALDERAELGQAGHVRRGLVVLVQLCKISELVSIHR